ncbi:MAG: 30S ribosomal protein S6 [Chlamydiia bacterium]|nr:30S ribosomal protein S6 [Chlamydiia bacterium]MCH9615128.1 30S ribosomal protein S6 [Chlamydiia bacterium]MCH9628550.1 30S ribosomal protein S6 [Chlamydiia bacterium]
MTKDRRHLYEGMYVFNGTLSEDGCKKAIERITSSIAEKGGEIHKDLPIGRRKLAYEINRMRQGHYYLVYFSVGTKAINEMWSEYHLNEDLLRYMTLKVESVPENIEFKPAKAVS